MGSLLVGALQPLCADLPDLVECLKQKGVEDFRPVRAIEAFDEGVLLWLISCLKWFDTYALEFRPLRLPY